MHTKFWLQNLKRNRPFGTNWRRWEDNIEKDVTKIESEDRNWIWIKLAWDRAQWRASVDPISGSKKGGEFID
jgi:hypothetical protein